MAQGKDLHNEWQKFKNGLGAVMIKDAGVNFNGGLGPKLDTLDSKWGTAAGQKVADEIKTLVTRYKQMAKDAKPMKEVKALIKSTNPYEAQKKEAERILNNIKVFAEHHAVKK